MGEKPFPYCEKCSLKEEGNFVPWQYPPNQGRSLQWNIMFVGQAPGETESITKVPFSGKAGKMCYRLMTGARIVKGLVAITNLCSCPPPEDRVPSIGEQELCSQRLYEEISIQKPNLIIALGKPASMALANKFDRGNLFDLLPKWHHTCKVLTTFHPSFVMRQRQWIDIVTGDLKQIIPFLTGSLEKVEFVSEDTTKHFLINPPISDVVDFLEKCSKTITTFDLETSGLDARRDKLYGGGFCHEPPYAMVVDMTEESPYWECIERYLKDKNSFKALQNGQFDGGFIYAKRGFHIEGIKFDTMLAEQLLHSDLPKDLQSMRCTYTNIPSYKRPRREILFSLKEGRQGVTMEECGWDVITTYEVMRKQRELLTTKEISLKENLLLPLVEVINEMEHRGVVVDVRELAKLFALGRKQLAPMEKEFEKIGLNPNSSTQITKAWGLKDSREDTLEALIKRGQTNEGWYQKLLDYRKLAKLESTFLRGVYERLLLGRIHTHFGLDGTGTGRLNSRDPNLQNVPPPMRAIYIPDQGYQFAECDFRALELRVIGLIAPEPTLLKKLDSGIDPHSEIHALCYPNLKEETHESRLRAKAIVFGTIGGRGAISIAREFGISVAIAEKWQAFCINTYPGFINYKRRCEQQLRDDGYISTPFGRRRYVTAITQGYNSPMQSTAADVTLTTLLRLHRAGFDLRVTVHDSFVCQIKSFDEVKYLKEVAEQPFEIFNGYSFPVKCKVGSNWFDLEEVI